MSGSIRSDELVANGDFADGAKEWSSRSYGAAVDLSLLAEARDIREEARRAYADAAALRRKAQRENLLTAVVVVTAALAAIFLRGAP